MNQGSSERKDFSRTVQEDFQAEEYFCQVAERHTVDITYSGPRDILKHMDSLKGNCKYLFHAWQSSVVLDHLHQNKC
jgi:hypothetical protein